MVAGRQMNRIVSQMAEFCVYAVAEPQSNNLQWGSSTSSIPLIISMKHFDSSK